VGLTKLAQLDFVAFVVLLRVNDDAVLVVFFPVSGRESESDSSHPHLMYARHMYPLRSVGLRVDEVRGGRPDKLSIDEVLPFFRCSRFGDAGCTRPPLGKPFLWRAKMPQTNDRTLVIDISFQRILTASCRTSCFASSGVFSFIVTMNPRVRDLYKRAMHVGKDYPTGLPHVREIWKKAMRNQANCPACYGGNDALCQEQLLFAVNKGRFMVKEMMGVIQMKKYRTMKQRYGGGSSWQNTMQQLEAPYVEQQQTTQAL